MNITRSGGYSIAKCLTSSGQFFADHFHSFSPSGTKVYTINYAILCVVNVLLAFTGTFLNTITVLAYWRSPQLQKKTPYFTVILLSLSDFGVGILCHPTLTVILIDEILGYENCPLAAIFLMVTYTLSGMSLMTLLVMNIERYLSIVHPIFHRNNVSKRRLLAAAATLWPISVAEVCVALVSENVFRYLMRITICVFLAVYLFIYVKIFRTRRVIGIVSSGSHGNTQLEDLRRMKLAKSCLLVVSCTLLCFLPMPLTSYLWHTTFYGAVLWVWSVTLFLAASTFNSVIFFWRNSCLRNEAKEMLRQTFRKSL